MKYIIKKKTLMLVLIDKIKILKIKELMIKYINY